jgi:hypothetical protein
VLQAIRNTIETVCEGDGRPTSNILSGDFSRHHPTWSGNKIYPRFAEQATELIDFFQTHNLQGCLPRGTPTFWSLNKLGRTSTIDQTVTDNPYRLIKCHLYHENYGSDHCATWSEWDLQAKRHVITKPKRAYDRADWDKIWEESDSRQSHVPPRPRRYYWTKLWESSRRRPRQRLENMLPFYGGHRIQNGGSHQI